MSDYYETRKHNFGSFLYRPDTHGVDLPRGFALLRNFLSCDLASRLAGATDYVPETAMLSMEPSSSAVRSALCVHEHSPFDKACAAVWSEAERILGATAYVHQSRINQIAGHGQGPSAPATGPHCYACGG